MVKPASAGSIVETRTGPGGPAKRFTMGLYESAALIAFGVAAALVWRWLVPPAHLVVGSRGILDRRLGVGWILWDEIEGAYRMKGGDSDGVCLRVHVTKRLAPRLSKRRGAGLHDRVEVPVRLDGTSVSGVDLLQRIQRHGCCEA